MNATVTDLGLAVVVMVDGEVVYAVAAADVDELSPLEVDVVIHPDVTLTSLGRALAFASEQLVHIANQRRVKHLVQEQIKKQQFDNAAAFDPDTK